MKAVVIMIETRRAVEKRLSLVDRTGGHLGLGGGELQIDVFRRCVRGLGVIVSRVDRLAVELIRVTELRQNVGPRIVNGLSAQRSLRHSFRFLGKKPASERWTSGLFGARFFAISR